MFMNCFHLISPFLKGQVVQEACKGNCEGNCEVDCGKCNLVQPLYECGWSEGDPLNFQNGLCWMKKIDYRCLKCLCEPDSEYLPYVGHLCGK